MDAQLLPAKSVQRVVLVTAEGPQVLYEKPKGRKKSSKGLRRPEKIQRKLVEAMQAGNAEYLRRHEKSARKRKDGWARDLVYNATRAQEKAIKKLRRIRFV